MKTQYTVERKESVARRMLESPELSSWKLSQETGIWPGHCTIGARRTLRETETWQENRNIPGKLLFEAPCLDPSDRVKSPTQPAALIFGDPGFEEILLLAQIGLLI